MKYAARNRKGWATFIKAAQIIKTPCKYKLMCLLFGIGTLERYLITSIQTIMGLYVIVELHDKNYE